MKILHISDLHLGRQFNGLPLEEDHAAILDQVVRALLDRDADLLVIAGDVFDRAAPPASAVRQFNGFLSRVAAQTRAAVVMIAGNHDSADRISAMSVMTDRRRALIRGAVSADEPPLALSDAHGPVFVSALPFSYEYAARGCFADEAMQTPEDVLVAQIAAARRHVPPEARWVVAAHAFVAGGQGSDGERPLVRVGGTEMVRPEIFAGAHYVALGHLHRPQSAGAAHIRYSGAPLAFGFDEAEALKSMTLVELDGAGEATIETIPFVPLRQVRILRGKHAELLLAEPSTDFVKAILTDDIPVIDAMKRLRAVFPNACDLSYERDRRRSDPGAIEDRLAKMSDPLDVMNDFLDLVTAERMTAAEQAVVTAALHELRREEEDS